MNCVQKWKLWEGVHYKWGRGVWGPSSRNFCGNMPWFGGHFDIQLAIFYHRCLFTWNWLIFLSFDKKVGRTSELSSWRYRHAPLLPDNPACSYLITYKLVYKTHAIKKNQSEKEKHWYRCWRKRPSLKITTIPLLLSLESTSTCRMSTCTDTDMVQTNYTTRHIHLIDILNI